MEKNLIERRKGQLLGLGIAALVVGALAMLGGIAMIVGAVLWVINPLLLAFGIIAGIVGAGGIVLGCVFTCTGSAIKATHGSIVEENLGKGTVNMHKCKNCGAELEEGKEICAECQENLK